MSPATEPLASLLDHDLTSLKQARLRLLAPGERGEAHEVRICVDRGGTCPPVDPGDYDVMLTTAADPLPPWLGVPSTRLEGQLASVQRQVQHAPTAAAILVRLLRLTEALSFADALEVESLAYSTLLGGDEFARWLAGHGPVVSVAERARVDYAREGGTVTLALASPASRNAMTAAMRDALFEALANVVEDPSEPRVILRAYGRCFSVGGDLAEFGSAGDLALAHRIRVARSCAMLIDRLGERAMVQVHGACIGSGIEIAAAAHRREAAADTFIQLPELRMGLIPGAGGTVTLPRAIGRHRTAWLALGGFRVAAPTARAWGLLDAVVS